MAVLWDGSAILDGSAPGDAVTAAVELNLAARMCFFAAEPGVRLVNDAESLRFITDQLYRVARVRLDPENAEPRIDALLAHARRRPRYISWVVGPASTPADLARRLQARGLFVDMREPGMVAALADLKPPRSSRFTESLKLCRLNPGDSRELHTFTEVASASFRRPISLAMQLHRLVNVLGAENPLLDNIRLYLARLPSGEAVGSAITFAGGGVAGLYTVGTLPAYRRLGIGSALTHHALMDSRAAGMQVAVLHASEQGRGVYERLGFRQVCEMSWLSTY